MIQLLQRHPLYAALGALAVVLLVVLGFETGWGTRIVRPAPGTDPVKAAAIAGAGRRPG